MHEYRHPNSSLSLDRGDHFHLKAATFPYPCCLRITAGTHTPIHQKNHPPKSADFIWYPPLRMGDVKRSETPPAGAGGIFNLKHKPA